MNKDLSMSPPAGSRVLILSLRNFEAVVGCSFLFELEYAVCDFEQVDVIAPNFSPTIFNKITRKISRSTFEATGKTLPIGSTYNQFSLNQE